MKKEFDGRSSAIIMFRFACKELAQYINKQLFDNSRSPYWVADKVGGTCDFGDADFLTPEEMVLILENHVTYDDYAEWRDANIKYGETQGYINLPSWIKGCRHSMLNVKPKYGEWISVDDMLPEYEEDVLVCDIAEPGEQRFGHRSNNPKVWRDHNAFAIIHNEERITHWMRIKTL